MNRLLTLSAFILVVVVTGCGGGTEQVEVIKEITVEVPVTVEVIKEVTVEIPVTVVVEATSEISAELGEALLEAVLAPTPTPIVGVGIRTSPVPLTQVANYDTSQGHEVKIALLQIERGDSALDILNPEGTDEWDIVEPAEGTEIILARFVVENVGGNSDDPLYVSYGGNFAASVDNRDTDSMYDLYPHGIEETLYTGGKAEGWTGFGIPVGSNVEAIRFYSGFNEDGIWFAIE